MTMIDYVFEVEDCNADNTHLPACNKSIGAAV